MGEMLGPVGGRIVADVFLGLLQADPNSYIQAPWSPTLPQLICTAPLTSRIRRRFQSMPRRRTRSRSRQGREM